MYRYSLALPKSTLPFNVSPFFMRVNGDIVEVRGRNKWMDIPVEGIAVTTVGNARAGWLGAGSSIVATLDNSAKTKVITISLTKTSIAIELDVTYKTEQPIEEEGIDMPFKGAWSFDKDANVHIEGGAVVAETFGSDLKLYTDYGERQAHNTITVGGDDNLQTEQTRVASENRNAKLTHLVSGYPVRILCQPNGNDATFTTVIHRDAQTADRLLAVLYGSSDSGHADYGVKGFISRGLTGTWTCYGTDFDVGSEAIMDVFGAMHVAGLEICPNSILPGDDDRDDAIAYLPGFNTSFSSRNWTDHALGSGQRTLGLSSLGWDETETVYYIMDLLETYSYEYAWAYQDENMINGNQLLEHRFGFPYEMVYQNPNLTKPTQGPMWLYKNSVRVITTILAASDDHETIIDSLINECGVVTDHDYYAANTRDGILYDSGTPYLVTDKFDNICQYLKTKIDAGELWNPTMSEFCDYFRKLLNVSVAIGENQFTVTNSGAQVDGCSFLIGGATVTPAVGGTPINSKHVTRGTICWLNLPAGETVITY